MLDSLFDSFEVGARLQTAAKVLFTVDTIALILGYIIMLVSQCFSGTVLLLCLLGMALAIGINYVSCLIIYSLGVRVENSCWKVQQDQIVLEKLEKLEKELLPASPEKNADEE